MKIFTDLNKVTVGNNHTIVTIGTFDGVHLGHQQLIRRVVSESRKTNLHSVVITFDIPPRCYISPSNRCRMITTIDQKIEIIRKMGVNILVVLNFNPSIARIEPEEFITILQNRIKMVKMVVGQDFSFWKERRGNSELLRKLGYLLHFEIEVFPLLTSGIGKISSTRIRNLLKEHNYFGASVLLGYNFG